MEEIRKYISSVKWQYAKTMPEIPHEYTIKGWNPDKVGEFEDFVKYINEHGKDEEFYGKTYRYLVVDDYKYWAMDDVINREIINQINDEEHSLPWEDVIACRNRGNTITDKTCPQCGGPVERFYFRSPDSTWPALVGTEGWIEVCINCKKQLSYEADRMS